MSEEVTRGRGERAARRGMTGKAAAALAAARGALATGKSLDLDDADRKVLSERHAKALAAVEKAKRDEREALAAIDKALGEFRISPLDRIATLDAGVPVALFPVRIETRFRREARDVGAGELLVRIYPDSILADEHEPLLTAAEVEFRTGLLAPRLAGG